MAKSVIISERDMHDFLARKGFTKVTVEGTKELVYGKIVRKNLCLRVYTSLIGGRTRGNGEDAIRTCLVTKVDGIVRPVGKNKRVHRVEGWRGNLEARIDGWEQQLGPACPKCGAVTVVRESRRGLFWGCSQYPHCNSVQAFQPVRHAQAA